MHSTKEHTGSNFAGKIGTVIALVLVTALVIFVLTHLYVPAHRAYESEVKANLHNIQLAVERYSVDHQDRYPAYLIGGEATYAPHIAGEPEFGGVTVSSVVEVADLALLADPLLRAGYMDAYPRNPFARGLPQSRIINLQEGRHAFQSLIDPLRNGPGGQGEKYGTRFGPFCETMGNVLADFRYSKWSSKSGKVVINGDLPTHADFGYRCWDMVNRNGPGTVIPGQFFYKSAGDLYQESDAELSAKKPYVPSTVDIYILGAYGNTKTKGKDGLGDETPITFKNKALWPWTRSEIAGTKGGSPYKSGDYAYQGATLFNGNSNGVRDGIILFLSDIQ